MRILIATGIYPPDIGGPAQYAVNVEKVWKSWGHRVDIRTFRLERKLPTVIRHIYYFVTCISSAVPADFIFILDTFSVAVPAVLLAKIFGKKTIIRTGGDFLWESYVERTGDLVLLKNFYLPAPRTPRQAGQTSADKFSFKEKVIFRLTKWALNNSSAIIFSTEWQKNIFLKAYELDAEKLSVIENYYGPKEISFEPSKKDFIAGTRPLKWKNDKRLAEAFVRVKEKGEVLIYDNETKPFSIFMERLAHCYAVILVSLGDVSPNMILDAIRHNKPFILTRETGLYERLKDCAIFVDPEDVDDIAEKILWLSDPVQYEEQKKKIKAFTFTHSFEQIGSEILAVYRSIPHS